MSKCCMGRRLAKNQLGKKTANTSAREWLQNITKMVDQQNINNSVVNFLEFLCFCTHIFN